MKTYRDEVEFARRVRAALDKGAAGLDQSVTRRLYEARCDALRHQAAPVAVLSLAGVGHTVSESLHRHYRGILAFLALAVGAAGVHIWQVQTETTELADIDSALLSDEVSPSAYTDPGFLEWLRHVSEQDDDSSPQ
ncbi:MAG TPA: DUF3619 family protein [Rhodocyclaceae bacterium]|nr:DUF3619 family protein [Rhodocyclaceae bacterium]